MRCLVVGDGDFSYSLAIARREQSFQVLNLVATSLESNERVGRCPKAAENILSLKAVGALVLHNIDGTALKDCSELSKFCKTFDRIVFNFPHSGGKSNVGENRHLLSGFFRSASELLAEGGEVEVSLCRGQGGTPVDSVARGYHNSWKVVEMAAEGGLILTRVRPFRPEDYPGYTPSGYRGQNRGFSLEGALIHTFTLPQLTALGQQWRRRPEGALFHRCKSCYPAKVDLMPLPSYLEEGLNYPVMSQAWHPVVTVRDALVEALEKQRHVWRSVESLTEETAIVHLLPMADQSPRQRGVGGTGQPTTSSSSIEQQALGHKLLELTQDSRAALREEGSALRLFSGAVVRSAPVSLSPSEQPITHGAIGILAAVPEGPPPDRRREAFCPEFEQALLGALTEVLSSSVSYTLQSPTVTSCPSSSTVPMQCKEVHLDFHGRVLTIARCGVYGRETTSDIRYLVFAVNLDSLAMVYFNVEDVRMLWSKDVRFAQQFLGKDLKSVAFKPFSLFPPTYTHDVSFWWKESPAEGGDDIDSIAVKLGHVFRDVAGSRVISLECMDTYRPEGSSVGGYCYRVVYQSVDGPLSRGQASELQLSVREEMKRRLCIELR